MIARLQRFDTGDYGTLGTIVMPMLTVCTIELPWRDNERDISCIPAKLYHCVPYEHPRRGLTYVLMDVPDRSEVMIHIGNYAGDRSIGYKTDSMGCILPGLHHDHLTHQTAVVQSRKAMNRLRKVIGRNAFTLMIEDMVDITGKGAHDDAITS